jgi:exosortase
MGSLIVCGIALVLILMGIVGFQWGLRRLRIVAVPLAFLLLMVPLPSYLTGQFQWRLKIIAGTVSAATLRLLRIPVFQDGNFLKLPNYVLEVKQACSGSRSIFALMALAMVLGYVTERKWQTRILLLAAAPVLAIGANVIRIVGTGIIAWNYGDLAANDSLHSAWGVMVFLIAVSGLLGIQRLMRWATNSYA